LQYNPDSRVRRFQENEMLRNPQYFLVIFALAAAAALPGYAQDKNQDKTKEPRVVLDLEKSPPAKDAKAKEPASADAASAFVIAPPFGKACSSFGAAKDGYRNFDHPYTVAELFGAPIVVVIIRRIGASQDKPDREELRKHILAVLNAQTTEVSRYEDWDESVPAGIVTTIQFDDHSKGVLEESAGHVCFSDYAGTVWWLRIPVTPKPQP
jgi:hypothetical protein